MKKILLIIPAYNEQYNILDTVTSITKSKLKNKVDYIVINDGSKDKTGLICDENNINHIDLIHNLGIGGAVQTGYKYAVNNDYDIAVQFDGDGQHDINYVEKIIDPIIKGKCNMCIGSRFILPNKEGFKSSKSRRVGIKVISAFIKIFTKNKIYDPTSGFRAVDKKVMLEFINEYPTEYPEPISTVMLLKMKYEISEVPVMMHHRKEGESSIHTWKSVYYMINVLLSILITSIRRY
ncbi:MAG: glycosyltransferase family 2 protein [Bacilli bacterium]|nr:glycosyltransferase family 2 protein [Bacilli bacterium]MDD3304943.1 glycosyltransferase family 2 protein [Bacilli bacterium]MDD4053958.1 glycosyltransferase family 2 protein [Bacilli bacterium]MDD4411424.1 glycosyltransferase family 2 protein [Bacilli bacterium]